MKTFKVTLTEEELKAVIRYNANYLASGYGATISTHGYNVERSSRVHELTKKLNKSVEDKTEEQQPETTEEQTKDNASAVDGWG